MSGKSTRKSRRGFEVGSPNVYADLNAPDAVAMLVKAKLTAKLTALLAERGLTQTAAAELLAIPQPKLSNLLRGHFHGISERKLMDYLTRLGADIEIVVHTKPRTRRTGSISVVIT